MASLRAKVKFLKNFVRKYGYNHSSKTVCTAIVTPAASQLLSTETYFLAKFLIEL